MQTGCRWYARKQLLAMLRGGDYAHPGEEDAITKAFEGFPKKNNQTILDAGCGLGGTANFITQQGWGKVTGFDIEPESIAYAKETYPACEFLVSDVNQIVANLPNKKFDIICAFNAFFAFPDQTNALRNFRQLANEETTLVLFEYTDLTSDGINPLIVTDDINKIFLPIRVKDFPQLAHETGWECTQVKNLDKEYLQWYEQLLHLIKENKTKIIAQQDEVAFAQLLQRYTTLFDAIKNKILGGCIVYAKPSA